MGRRPRHREILGEGAGEPALQRIRAEVALHDEPGIRAGTQPRQPLDEHAVELVLAHPDRRVRADRHELDGAGNIFGSARVDIVQAERLGVAAHKVKGSLVDVHRPHRGTRGLEGEAESYRPPPASEVEEVAARRGRRGVGEKHLGSGVDAVRAEDAARRRERVWHAEEGHLDGTELERTCGG